MSKCPKNPEYFRALSGRDLAQFPGPLWPFHGLRRLKLMDSFPLPHRGGLFARKGRKRTQFE